MESSKCFNIYDQKHIPVEDAIQQATNAILDYKQHQQSGSAEISSNGNSRSHEQNRSPPPMATLKATWMLTFTVMAVGA
jgi:hypothetical protein